MPGCIDVYSNNVMRPSVRHRMNDVVGMKQMALYSYNEGGLPLLDIPILVWMLVAY